MVAPRTAIRVADAQDSRWSVALEFLKAGDAAIGLDELALSVDLATDKSGPRLHIEFACPFDPVLLSGTRRSAMEDGANDSLGRARAVVAEACAADPGFNVLVTGSGVVYECVHDYGMGTLLVATARRAGPLIWKQ